MAAAAERTGTNVPLGQGQEKVLAGPLDEAGDAEPRGLAVVLGARVAGDGVLDNLAAGLGGDDLGGVGEVANDGDAGNGARRRGAEGAGGRGHGGGATEEHGRHGCGCWWFWSNVGVVEGLVESVGDAGDGCDLWLVMEAVCDERKDGWPEEAKRAWTDGC